MRGLTISSHDDVCPSWQQKTYFTGCLLAKVTMLDIRLTWINDLLEKISWPHLSSKFKNHPIDTSAQLLSSIKQSFRFFLMKSLITGKLPPLNFGELKSESKICRSIVVKIDCTTLSNNRFSLKVRQNQNESFHAHV